MRKIFSKLELIERWMCIGAFFFMAFATFLQVLNRNILHLPISWTEELARYSMIWMALLGTEVGLREGKQMSVEAFTNRLTRSVQKIIFIFGDLLCFAFAGITTFFSIDLLKMQVQTHQLSAVMKIPMVFMYSILTLCFTVMSISRLYSAIRYIRFGIPDAVESTETEEGF